MRVLSSRWVLRAVAAGAAGAAVSASACSKSKPPAVPASDSAAAGAATAAAPAGRDQCPPTGQWAPCSLVYHLGRAGLALKVDSSASPDEKELGGTPLIVKIGQNAQLELHVYPDSAARIAAARKLTRTDFVDATAPQTMKRERTLIESVNVIGLLTSLNAHLRERVSDAITAGPPQPPQAVKLPPPSTKP